jgi:hypothetical protein
MAKNHQRWLKLAKFIFLHGLFWFCPLKMKDLQRWALVLQLPLIRAEFFSSYASLRGVVGGGYETQDGW